MPEKDNRSLQDRVEQLERAVETLQRRVQSADGAGRGETPKPSSRSPGPEPAPQPTKQPPRHTGIIWRSETWLKIVGIGLLLLGVAFLFKFSVDQGWITEPVRVGFAVAIGIVLFVAGLRIHDDRRAFSQVLLGGSIATFYIAGFAAFQLYALVPVPTGPGSPSPAWGFPGQRRGY